MPKYTRSVDESTDPRVGSFDDTNVGPEPVSPGDCDTQPNVSPPPARPPSLEGAGIGREPVAEKTVVTGSPSSFGSQPASSEATVVGHNPLELGRPAAIERLRGRLVVVEGKETGREIELRDGALVFGRSQDADVTLLDIQISRRHIEVVASHNGVLVTDLGSGNGTLVNGHPIDKVNLVHGDEVTLGDHVLRFEEEGPVAQALPVLAKQRSIAPPGRPEPAVPGHAVDIVRRARRRRTQGSGGNRKRFAILGGSAAIVFAAVIVAMALRPEPGPIEPPPPSSHDLARQSFVQGMQRFRDGAYAEALPLFEDSVAKMPDHQEAARYVSATKREIAAQGAMNRGTQALAAEDFEGAREAFARVPSDSLRRQEAEQSLRRVNEAEARKLTIRADDQLDGDRLDDAAALYRRALSVAPDYEPARSGLSRVEQRRESISKMTAAQQAAAQREAARRQREEEEAARRQVRQMLAVGERQFDQGDFNGALDTFEGLSNNENRAVSGPARQKAAAVREFRPAYERGMRAAETRDTEQAVTDLTVAERQARLVSPDGALHQQVRTRLADMRNMQGRIAYNAQRYSVAYQNWSEALKVNPQHRPSRDGMNDLIRLGNDVYMEAYMTRALNPTEAMRKYQQVMSMTPPDSEPHTKARDRLAEQRR